MTLRWEKQTSGGWYAYSGELMVAQVGELFDKSAFYYSVSAVHTKWIGKGHGHVASEKTAKAAVARVWSAWLAVAGLEPKKETA